MRNLIIFGLIALLVFGCVGSKTTQKSAVNSVQTPKPESENPPDLDASSFAIDEVDSSPDLTEVGLEPPN